MVCLLDLKKNEIIIHYCNVYKNITIMLILLFAYQKMMGTLLFISLLPCLHMVLLLILDFIITIIFGQQGVQQLPEDQQEQ